jgi:hypothetical protein
MTQSPTPNPNPNEGRRRRLTADELIAVLVAMAGIGSIFWWSIGSRSTGWNLSKNTATGAAPRNTLPLPTDNGGNAPAVGGTRARGSGHNDAAPSLAPSIDSYTHPDDRTTGQTNTAGQVAAGTAAIAGLGGIAASASPQVSSSPGASASPLTSAVPFKDVEKSWAKDYITVLRERGVLDDFGGSSFQPDLPITRGDYAKMLDRAFGQDRVTTTQVLDFKDIPATYARREAIDKSVKLGFMTGYSKTLFKPDENIPRYQMQISLAKGLGLQAKGNVDDVLAKYDDVATLPPWAKAKTAAAVEAGLVVKDDRAGSLQPIKKATRGEAAALVYGALEKSGKLSPSTSP